MVILTDIVQESTPSGTCGIFELYELELQEFNYSKIMNFHMFDTIINILWNMGYSYTQFDTFCH